MDSFKPEDDKPPELSSEWKRATFQTPRTLSWREFCDAEGVHIPFNDPDLVTYWEKYSKAQRTHQVKYRLLGTQPAPYTPTGQADMFLVKRRTS